VVQLRLKVAYAATAFSILLFTEAKQQMSFIETSAANKGQYSHRTGIA
jgi:hypothetical protein